MENYIDSLIEKAFSDGYEYAQKEFGYLSLSLGGTTIGNVDKPEYTNSDISKETSSVGFKLKKLLGKKLMTGEQATRRAIGSRAQLMRARENNPDASLKRKLQLGFAYHNRLNRLEKSSGLKEGTLGAVANSRHVIDSIRNNKTTLGVDKLGKNNSLILGNELNRKSLLSAAKKGVI